MLYDLSKPLDAERLKLKVEQDLRQGRLVSYERKEIRSTRQNSYLHLILGAVAVETGTQLEYTKQEYFKALVNPGIFLNEINDKYAGTVRTLRSTRDLTKEEMSTAIDRFKRWAAEQGIYLPEPGDEERLREIALEMDRAKRYL